MKERVFISLVIYIGDERKSAYKFNDFFLGGGGGELIITTTEKRYSNLSSNSKENTNVTWVKALDYTKK